MPYFILNPMQERTCRDRVQRALATIATSFAGRFSGFRFALLAAPSHPGCGQWPDCGVRLRLQRRDRNGVSPFSLLSCVSARLNVAEENSANFRS